MNNLDFNYFCNNCPHDQHYREEHCFVRYKVRSYRRGDYLAFKGDVARELTILVEGSVTTELLLDSGVVYTSKRHTAPYPLGALAIFAKENHYRADIIAFDDRCLSISVSREDVELQMSQCPHFLRNFIAYGMSKLDMFTTHLSILTHKSLKGRLAHYIFTLAQGGEFSFDKRQGALATYLGVERPSLARAIGQLVDQGIITHHRGAGRILDVRALKDLLA